MSEDLTPAPQYGIRKDSPAAKAVANAREKLTRYVERAAEILQELAESSENDRVRLAAADSILDRAGVGKSSTIETKVDPGMHDDARRQAEEIMAKLKRNKDAGAVSGIPLDALIVHEGDDVIEATAS